ncbi:MAG: hypothetical protein O9267_09295 [Flavobacterium sp.]|uniref:hypothetical protein n=1 Tax=Flavobacterium sp. TaxID=239 RepID=UPI0022CC146E|nr:hypothetical protein [Flavobacterium sp.]MCZ8197789.1 hypothetical protein [Flavobacterium sp.]
MYTKILNPESKISNFLIGIFIFLIGVSSNAQCAMCRASLQGDQNVAKAEAVNDGIVYLMIIPYVLVGAIGYYIFRMYKKKE